MPSFKEAFALSKDEVRLARPLGTIRVTDYIQSRHDGRSLRHPQPSADSMDPLNLSFKLKIASLVCMSTFGFLSNFTSSSITSAIPLLATPLAFNPPVPVGRLTHLVAVNAIMLGVSNLLWVPVANTFGRRPVILLGTLLLTVFSIWAAVAKSFDSLLAAPGTSHGILSPWFREPFHSCPGLITQHKGFYTVFLALGPLVGGVVGGYIAGNLGIPWINWINAIISGALFVTCFFFQPETLFNRDDPQPSEVAEASVGPEKSEDLQEVENISPLSLSQQRFSYTKSLEVGVYCAALRTQFLRPFLTLRLPGVWLVMLWYGGLVGGIVALSAVGPTILAMPPYLWGVNAGCINVGGIIGVLIGFLTTAVFSDRVISWQSKRSATACIEAEARLSLAIPGLCLAVAGLWTFGFCADHPAPHMWIGMEFGLGMLCFGIMMVPSIGFNYLIESYHHLAPDAFVAITFLRGIISFCWTFFVSDWVTNAGAAVPFGVFGGMMGASALLLIPVLFWGKRMRIATEKWVR
ncbi:hypothetical protein N7474_005004 [Penicillium riverlandense]|uniref:uncharacterized protein n=1 Tax=Penicillium riverlandense TaxID=1903569 RepID=UPI00254840F5|nr:uncharacterized protein N7474_005004 [Penicillium riverlandense]KAJ5819413.1 hypothetical protein N7474_005004 [Penicillium riverlandense]